MALTNPRKKFKFRITILPLPYLEPFAVQEVTNPSHDIEEVEHGAGVTTLKTAGMVKIGKGSISRILSANKTDVSGVIWEWARIAQDHLFGIGGDPKDYKRVVQVDELANDGNTAIDTWYWIGCWPSTINGREFNRTDSNNTVESFELTCDGVSQNLPI